MFFFSKALTGVKSVRRAVTKPAKALPETVTMWRDNGHADETWPQGFGLPAIVAIHI
jgi:hypothetical protein